MIPIVELIRLEENYEHGTFGVLKINKRVFCVTLEPPDIENAQNISCIPAQQYICERVVSPRYGEVFEVKYVPDRSKVLFHAGNVDDHTKGCILLAEHYGKLRGIRAVLNSGRTMTRFMEEMIEYNEFHLTVREVY